MEWGGGVVVGASGKRRKPFCRDTHARRAAIVRRPSSVTVCKGCKFTKN